MPVIEQIVHVTYSVRCGGCNAHLAHGDSYRSASMAAQSHRVTAFSIEHRCPACRTPTRTREYLLNRIDRLFRHVPGVTFVTLSRCGEYNHDDLFIVENGSPSSRNRARRAAYALCDMIGLSRSSCTMLRHIRDDGRVRRGDVVLYHRDPVANVVQE